MTLQFILGFYGWLLIIAATIALNWFRIEIRHIKPTYFNSNWSRAVFGGICLILMTIDEGFDPAYLRTWITAIPTIVYIVSAWLLFFDPGLNIARGKDIDYRGKTSGLLDSMKIGFYYTIKVVAAIGLVWSIIILFQNH